MTNKEQKYFSGLEWNFVNTKSSNLLESIVIIHTFTSDDWEASYSEHSNFIGYGCTLSIKKNGKYYNSWTFGLGGTGGKIGRLFRKILKDKERKEQAEREKLLT